MATKPVTSTSVLSPVANKKRKEVLIKETPKFWLHVDADRDGAVDANPRDGEKWEWGKGKKGAVILVNNNDSDGDSKIDCDDQKVNAAADVQDIAQIEIRRTGSSPDASFKLVLSVSATHKDCVRIFDTRTAAGLEIIGPTKGESHTFSDSSFTLKQLGIEAVRYAGTGFDGLVPVTATLFDGAKTEVSKHTVLMRVAPWIMFNHFDKPEQIYVVTTPDNTTFVAELSAAASSASVPLAKIDGSIWQDDRWMQDIMEFGFSELPGHPAMRSVLETPRGRGLRGFPKTLMSSKLGYTLPEIGRAHV